MDKAKHIRGMADMLGTTMIVNLTHFAPNMLNATMPTGSHEIGMVGAETLRHSAELLKEYADLINTMAEADGSLEDTSEQPQ